MLLLHKWGLAKHIRGHKYVLGVEFRVHAGALTPRLEPKMRAGKLLITILDIVPRTNRTPLTVHRTAASRTATQQ